MTKYAAKGTVFAIEDAAVPGTFVAVAGVRSIDGPTLSTDEIDVSCHSSPGFKKQFVPGFGDGGSITLELLFDPADVTQDLTTDGLLDLWNRGIVKNAQIIWPDAGASEWDFVNGFFTSYEVSATHDEALTASVGFKVSGAPAFPAGTP